MSLPIPLDALRDLIPPKLRLAIYTAYITAFIGNGALEVAGLGTGKTGDVLTYLAPFVVALAATHVDKKRASTPDE